jgi:hypothetical protein
VKYKPLSKEDLNELEKEFIDFLVINGITADDWTTLKNEQTSAAEDIINQFSDVVWEQTLRTTQYLVKREPSRVYCFLCEENEIYLKLYDKETNSIKKTSKAYTKTREQELFSMIEQGCEIDKDALYEKL